MLIVGMDGGLANQMFGYMFYLTLKERRDDIKVSTYIYEHFEIHLVHARHYLLDKLFTLPSTDYASDKEVQRLADFSRDIFSRVRRRVLKLHKASVFRLHNLVTSDHVWQANDLYHRLRRSMRLKETLVPSDAAIQRQLIARNIEELLLADNLYLVGCFGDFEYSKNIEGKVRQAFGFKLPLDEQSQRAAEQMAGEISVSLHVRRGDFVGGGLDVVTVGYYQRAMDYFLQRHENVHFWVFSNDIPYCQEHLTAGNMTFVNWNTGEDSWRDLELMSLCKHNIIANSTFSIWGAWLNANPDKVVICPKYSYRDASGQYGSWLRPTDWIALDN